MPTLEQKQQAAAAYATGMITHEYNFMREHRPELWAAGTQEEKDDFERRQHENALVVADSILTCEADWIRRVYQGALHPSNKETRKLWEALTGKTLPKGANATADLVFEYYADQIAAYRAGRRAEQDARDAEREAKELAREQAYLASILKTLEDGTDLQAEELIDVARHLEVELHPRTIGTIRKHLRSINTQHANIYKQKTKMPYSVFRAYFDCRNALHAKNNPEVLKELAQVAG